MDSFIAAARKRTSKFSAAVLSLNIVLNSLVAGVSAFIPFAAYAAAPTCDGLTATIYVEAGNIVGGPGDGNLYAGVLAGTAGNDVIVGTVDDDTISAAAGNDTICSLGGDDVVNGQAGDDVIFGGAGNDVLDGGADIDFIQGNNGNDEIRGGGGADDLRGGNGHDILRGDAANDVLNGGNGTDNCYGGGQGGDSDAECESTNPTKGMIVIKKNSSPDSATSFSFTGLGGFTLQDDGDEVVDPSEYVVFRDAGVYSITETAVFGWSLTDLICFDANGGTVATLNTANSSIDLTAGQVVTCTYTNLLDQVAPPVPTHLSPADGVPLTTASVGIIDWTDEADTSAPVTYIYQSSNSATTNPDGSFASPIYTSGNLATSQINAAGTPEGTYYWHVRSVDALNNMSAWSPYWTLIVDDTPYITVNANVINDNGGTNTSGSVVLKLNASPVSHGVATSVTVGNHVVSADPMPGYTMSIAGNCSGTGAVYVAAGQSKICSVTFDDIQPLLTVTKVVVNDDGGTKTETGFSLFVGATPVTTGVQAGFNAGNYTVSETGNAGYAATFSGDCSSTGAITLGVGEVKSCTITNNDIAPKLTVTKIVTNDNGGTSNSGSFVLRLDGNVITNNVQFTTTAGTHVVSEDPDSQYEGSFIVGDCDGSGSITLALADVKHCYITNDDIPAHVIVTTVMDNGNGGTKVASDFTVNFSGNNPDQTSFAGSDLGVDVTLDAGSYDVTQLADSQYATSYSADCAGSVMPGETKYCTITNDDIQPLLTVVMLIINNNVGSAGPADFNPTIDGSVVLDSVATGVNAGVRTVGAFANPGITGYLGSISGDCDADGHITLLPGDVKSCVFTFDDIVPDGLSEEQQESIEEAGNGVSRGSGTSKLRAAVNFVTQSLFSNIAPGAFGGGPNVPYSTQEIDVICSMQKALPNSATNGLIEWLAEYLASVMNRNADQLFTALKDPSLCPTVVEQAKAPVAPVALKVNAAGYPVSSNDTWNKCITGRVTLLDIRNNPDKDKHGLARDCSDYHTGAVWYHPDLKLFFTFDKKNKITSVPQGYVVQKEQAVSLND